MILYHFTKFDNLPSILAQGLKAATDAWVDDDTIAMDEPTIPPPGTKVLCIPKAVWFTSEADGPSWWLDAERKPTHQSEARLKVVIPSHDKRLVNWKRHIKKARLPLEAENAFLNGHYDLGHDLDTSKWWMYRGDVPTSFFRDLKITTWPGCKWEKAASAAEAAFGRILGWQQTTEDSK
jgi:hypothetical protein